MRLRLLVLTALLGAARGTAPAEAAVPEDVLREILIHEQSRDAADGVLAFEPALYVPPMGVWEEVDGSQAPLAGGPGNRRAPPPGPPPTPGAPLRYEPMGDGRTQTRLAT